MLYKSTYVKQNKSLVVIKSKTYFIPEFLHWTLITLESQKFPVSSTGRVDNKESEIAKPRYIVLTQL